MGNQTPLFSILLCVAIRCCYIESEEVTLGNGPGTARSLLSMLCLWASLLAPSNFHARGNCPTADSTITLYETHTYVALMCPHFRESVAFCPSVRFPHMHLLMCCVCALSPNLFWTPLYTFRVYLAYRRSDGAADNRLNIPKGTTVRGLNHALPPTTILHPV